MKTYEIEVKRTSFITLQIVAESEDEANATALDIVEDENQTDSATYEIESTREQEQATDETRSNGPRQ